VAMGACQGLCATGQDRCAGCTSVCEIHLA
jgi:hypothetical protein